MKTLEIIISAAIAFCLAILWYKIIFSSILKNKESAETKKPQSAISLILSFIALCAVAYFMNNGCLETHINGGNLGHGLFHGGLYALSYAVPILAIYHLHNQKSIAEFMIHAGFALFSFASIGGVLAILHLMVY